MKTIITILLFALVGAISCVSYAEDALLEEALTGEEDACCMMMGKPGMMGQGEGKMGMHQQGMRDNMMHKMNKSMVSTPDGGIVVMSGHSLLKYDQDLNLVKEVKIKMNMHGKKTAPPVAEEGQE